MRSRHPFPIGQGVREGSGVMGFWLPVCVAVWTGLILGDPGSGGSNVATQRVDLIELNHFIDKDGREIFRQVLFYDWSASHRRYVVRAWRLVKDDSLLPNRRWNPALYECLWHDDGLLRRVTAPAFRETWSQRDPERVNRQLLAEDARKPLLQPQLPR